MLTNDYVVGLIDGEGSFTVYVRDPRLPRRPERRYDVQARFYVKLIEEDKGILYALKDFFGCGNVYFQKDKRPNHKDCYRFEVANRGDLNAKVIPFFQKNLLKFSSKERDFELFCLMMDKINKGDHLTHKGVMELYKIKQRMH
tara:strand:+ start:421 stop:849 length:429 start_codon:yes stop_codon:yes gene_type:complete